MTKKNKIIMIAAIAAAVVLIVAGIIIAVVLNNSYLDSLKKYDVESYHSFNGVEILEKDGLYYLTKDGKKLSKTGYTALASVNEGYFYNDGEFDIEDMAGSDDFVLYDWYIARKPEANTWFLVNTEGEELAIAGENLEIGGWYLPYICFYDTVTYKTGALSLNALDSALSANAGEEISLTMYDSVEAMRVNNTLTNEYLVAHDDAGTGEKYVYFGANGAKLFESPEYEAELKLIYNEEADEYIAYFLTALDELYNIKGELVASDVDMANADGEVLTVLCTPEDETASAEVNAANTYAMVVTAKSSIKLLTKDYNLDNSDFAGNLIVAAMKNADGTDSGEYTVYNLNNGESAIYRYGIDARNDMLVVPTNEEKSLYAYIDTETGATLLTTKYGDMVGTNGVLASATELVEKNATITTNAPSAYLHFVAAGKTEVALTLAYNESISYFGGSADAPAYVITTTDSTTSTDYTLTSKSIYVPFANGTKTAAYDKVEYLEVFADGVGVALATDYTNGKYDFIDVATGAVVKTVTAVGADMAKTTFTHEQTYALRQDNAVEESTVEYAVIEMMKRDDNGNVASTETFAFSRNTPMTDDDKAATSAVTVVELGKNIVDVEAYDGHLVVHTTARSATVYTVSDTYALEQLVSLSYKVSDIYYYSNNIDDIYVEVADESYNYGLYDDNGTQILAPVYDEIDVVDEGYFVVADKGAVGAFKYKEKNGKTKQIIDFIYNEIEYLADGGFAVCDGCDDWYIYDEDKLVKDERIAGGEEGMGRVIDISVDAETGKVMVAVNYYFNFEGKLYIHRAEAEEVLGVDYYDYSDVYGDEYEDKEYYGGWYHNYMPATVGISDSGVKVVNFRNTDGSIIETKVIYPTLKGAFEFTLADGTWFYTPVKDLQITPVAGDVELEGKSDTIINVYKAHEAAGLAG